MGAGPVSSWCAPQSAGSTSTRSPASATSRWSIKAVRPRPARPIQVRDARTSRAAASSDAEKIAGRIIEYGTDDLAADPAGGADQCGGHRSSQDPDAAHLASCSAFAASRLRKYCAYRVPAKCSPMSCDQNSTERSGRWLTTIRATWPASL